MFTITIRYSETGPRLLRTYLGPSSFIYCYQTLPLGPLQCPEAFKAHTLIGAKSPNLTHLQLISRTLLSSQTSGGSLPVTISRTFQKPKLSLERHPAFELSHTCGEVHSLSCTAGLTIVCWLFACYNVQKLSKSKAFLRRTVTYLRRGPFFLVYCSPPEKPAALPPASRPAGPPPQRTTASEPC
jgi:hypothetical protein